MKEEKFEHGELVDGYLEGYDEPRRVHYISTLKQPEPYPDLHFTMAYSETPENYCGSPSMWFDEIRKIQKPEPELIDIEQRDSQSDTTTPDKSVTKRKLLNKVMSDIMMMDHEGLIKYIGEKSTNPHSYEFSMGGYLLEINLIDKV